jgi:hypothetical protein
MRAHDRGPVGAGVVRPLHDLVAEVVHPAVVTHESLAMFSPSRGTSRRAVELRIEPEAAERIDLTTDQRSAVRVFRHRAWLATHIREEPLWSAMNHGDRRVGRLAHRRCERCNVDGETQRSDVGLDPVQHHDHAAVFAAEPDELAARQRNFSRASVTPRVSRPMLFATIRPASAPPAAIAAA